MRQKKSEEVAKTEKWAKKTIGRSRKNIREMRQKNVERSGKNVGKCAKKHFDVKKKPQECGKKAEKNVYVSNFYPEGQQVAWSSGRQHKG